MLSQSKNITSLSLLIICLISHKVNTKLMILSGRLAAETMGSTSKDDPKDISYSLSSFGSVPYGMSLNGFAHYDPENEFGCNSFTIRPFTNDDVMPFAIVSRGSCQFLTKVHIPIFITTKNKLLMRNTIVASLLVILHVFT